MASQVNIPAAFKELVTVKKRYKVYYGGRGGGKSHAGVDTALLLGKDKKLFIVCIREVQKTLEFSMYKLFCDKIREHGYADYKILADRIINERSGTVIIFLGLRDTDPEKIKSLENADIAILDEAQTMGMESLNILFPTIRKDGSQVWAFLNRKKDNDPIWLKLCANPDDRTIVRKVNYYDNPFCPEEIKIQAKQMKLEDPDLYEHIFEGDPEPEGANTLIGRKFVRMSMNTKPDNAANNEMPVICGVDIARFGDDYSVFCFRQGRQIFGLSKLKGLDTVAMANKCVAVLEERKMCRMFLDITGLGAGVYDVIRSRGYDEVIGVNFGAKAEDDAKYGNRRAEMWDRLNLALRGEPRLCLPENQEIMDDLTAVEKKYDPVGRLLLEKKEDVKKRLGRSPDVGDAIALTFAEQMYESALAMRELNESYDNNVYYDD